MTSITWQGLTADYTEAERNAMRNLATMHPEEALLLHRLKATLDATMLDTGTRRIYAGAEGRWDEGRNTSLVRVTHRYADISEDLARYAQEVETEPDQLRIDEAA